MYFYRKAIAAEMPAGKADKTEGVMKYGTIIIASVKGSSISFSNIDLTNIAQIAFTASAPKAQLNAAGGTIEIRLDSPRENWLGKRPSFLLVVGLAQLLCLLRWWRNFRALLVFTMCTSYFQNEKAPAGQALFVVIDLEFQTSKSATANSTPAKATTATSLTERDLAAYAGKYKMCGLPFEEIEITIKAGQLQVNAGGNEGDLKPGPEADEFAGDNGAVFKFRRSTDKKVAFLTLQVQGFPFEGVKE